MVKILPNMLKYFTVFAIFFEVWLFKRLHCVVGNLSIYVLSITDC